MPLASVTATTTLVAGTTHRSHGEELVHVEVERAGILSLDLLVPATAPVSGRLIAEPRVGDWALERSARHLVLAVPAAGSWRFRVTAEDPQQQLEVWRLRTGFVPAARITEELVPGPEGRPMQARQLFLDVAGWLKTDELVVDPDPLACHGEHCDPVLKTDELVVDPDPFAGWTVRGFRTPSVGSELAPIAEHWIADPSCQSGERDDHGDTPGCATQVASGQVLAAELANGWGDDADVFAFTLRQTRTVRLETRGGVDTLGTLTDRHGHRLGVDDDGGTEGGFRLVRTLAPGRYFLRVEGSEGAEGAYELAFATERF